MEHKIHEPRKKKAARLKAVLEHTLKLVGRKPFDDVYVDDICEKVKISKVTLFKYFPTKEDILAYYFRIWCLRRLVDPVKKPRGASESIFLFEKLSEDAEAHPGIILSLIAYLSNPRRRSPKPFPVKLEEKKLPSASGHCCGGYPIG